MNLLYVSKKEIYSCIRFSRLKQTLHGLSNEELYNVVLRNRTWLSFTRRNAGICSHFVSLEEIKQVLEGI